MQKSFIIGVDVSKLKLDLHCFGHKESLVVDNNGKGFKAIFAWIKKKVSKDIAAVMMVMEHTGIYTYNLEQFLYHQHIDYVKRPALDIKRSMGMIRGKTDKADAQMISKYGWYRRDELKPTKPLAQQQQQLQQLMTYRDKLEADKTSLETRTKELAQQLGDKLHARIKESSQYLLQSLKVEIKAIEKTIKELIKETEALANNYRLVSSVKGIGFVTAVHMLIVTENFTRFTDPRKFACYCGVAPFEHRSGSSIRGKTRVSHLANKKIKALFTTAAMSAIQHDPDLKAKYEQKIKAGKETMNAINIIRFKLIERIFAVVKRQSPYITAIAA